MEEEKDYESEAVKIGWVPEEEWKGNKELWRPAKEFVERGEKIIPILKDQIKNLRADLDMTIKANESQVARAAEEAYNKATAEYTEKKKELDKKEIEAFSEGDTDAYLEIKAKKDDLALPEKPKPVEPQVPTPEFKEWSNKNPWYGDDNAMTLYAEAYAAKIASEQPTMAYDKVWQAITEEVKKEFPHKFQNLRRNEVGSVESGTTEPAQSGGGKYVDLPKSAKDQFKRLERQFKVQGRTYKKETYAKDWFSQS